MGPNFSYVLFDLDGTLTDPEEGITKSVQYALEHFGIQVTDRRELYKFIGPPLKDSFMEYYDFSEQQAEKASEKYTERFAVDGWKENIVYDGMGKLLQQLSGDGKKLMLATSKPEFFARKILDHFGLSSYFSFIGGATLDQSRNHKADVIRYVLQQNGMKDLEQVVMVGDRKYDVQGAKTFGISTIGVTYGYGSREELVEAGADKIVASVEELKSVLCGFEPGLS